MTTVAEKTLGKFTKIGLELAHVFMLADAKAEQTKRVALIKCVGSYGGEKSQVAIILDSYANEYKIAGYADTIVKSRKSELNAVFKAVENQAVSRANLLALEDFKGGYHAFIDFARSLTREVAKEPKVVIKEKLTDNQLANVENTLDNANLPQLERVVNEAITRVNDKASPDLAGYSQIVLIASVANQMLNNDKLDKTLHDFANSVLKSSNILLARIDSAKKNTPVLTTNEVVV